MTKIKVVVIVGPTAVGKTALGISLAKAFNGEIISGDSQQVYRQLDLGTAKATREEQEEAVHHLIDIREVTESYSAYDFVQDAQKAISDIISRGKLPIIVGGTGLYLQSLLEGYHLGGQVDQEAVKAYRQELEQLSDQEVCELLTMKSITIEQLNRRRAIRALELSQFAGELENAETAYEPLIVGLNDDRQVIYDRINQRVDRMLEAGLLEEAKWLYDNYPSAQASRGIGYKELFPYFAGEMTLTEASEQLKQNTRRFAKRQLTWFRNRMAVTFTAITAPDYPQVVYDKVRDFLAQTEKS
ncbi:UNVERIFIED_CONTAM: tRNA (adenosine(37)-N6)-dimethylallyltransferase MiaA [Streptococcus canis]|uniref:tRNA (adenosine(37)-N6)-dimethylallyltransferase MiaA n=1 Tax=Streptococcus canis TaxID=1329 RepID=UPI0013DBD9BA|nr:tRNA (adenosine(37)-N6)-dimethylallyltransferase MiaA [Streptococcus canis]QKG75422.1 tRNA (adenosine(37)-N6)-dimethylallyltransferase MiaA [Streptococcus canis]GMX36262.1 tRNA (adenosine(37)-N6)-dimethylallyltransferase MiaA [Streptococcus canis]GMX38799.1 tRNA (adenosine(37)-N6)-dimethylallyltransferase MiaA [Streptococcus canis]